MAPEGRMLEAALRYAQTGRRIFPIHSAKNGRCSCGKSDCGPRGKHPRTEHGFKDATTDQGRIRDWWGEYPDANIGLPTGKLSGLLVLDIDPRNGGWESLDRLIKEYGDLPSTVQQETGGGGKHYFFKLPEELGNLSSRNGLLPGIDIKADGGYVLLPPSNHVEGNSYRWVKGTKKSALAPGWLINLIQNPDKKKGKSEPAPEEIREGRRNTTLTSIAGTMRNRELGVDEISASLLVVNENRCIPPLSESEVKEISESVCGYEPGSPDSSGATPTQAQILIGFAENVELFSTPDLDGFTTFAVGDHSETWPIKSKTVRRWLTRKFYDIEGKPPGSQALQDALGVLEAKAQFEGSTHIVHTRVAGHNGNTYLDLCDKDWNVIKITEDGWKLTKTPPVKFRRAGGMLPLPIPVRGGSLDQLKSLLNHGDEHNWVLIVAWLVAALHPEGPYPVLLIIGEHGAAKSTQALLLKLTVDPSTAPLRSPPGNERDLVIAARNGRIIALDNLSSIPPWLSDALCRLATGGGLATRRLYTDDDEEIFNVKRPTIINSIASVAQRHDLVDRALIVNLPQIPDEKRRSEKTIKKSFERASPEILGALLDALVVGLQRRSEVQIDCLPRMADFAQRVVACEPALPWPEGSFLEIYRTNRGEAIETTLENDLVASAVRVFMERRETWEGTASQLLNELDEVVDERTRKARRWPNNASWMSRRLTISATFLRKAGIDIQFPTRSGQKRTIRIVNKNGVTGVTGVTENDKPPGINNFDHLVVNIR